MLAPFYERFSAASALPVLDELMCQMAATSFRSLHISCPCHSDLGEDETLLLHAMQCIQRGNQSAANSTLDAFVGGPCRTTFVRIASAYITELRHARLALTGTPNLALVPNS